MIMVDAKAGDDIIDSGNGFDTLVGGGSDTFVKRIMSHMI